MKLALLTALSILGTLPLPAQISGASSNPFYTSQSIVNAATQTAVALAPNAIATIYGTDLAFSTRAATSTDIVKGALPTQLDGVGVWINAMPCSLFYISPTQINFLVPYQITSSIVSVIVARDGVAGPAVDIQLSSTSPGLFLWGDNNPVAVHLDGQLISSLSPAAPGEVIVIYAAGLGRTVPDTSGGHLATAAFPIYYASQLQVLLDGTATPPGSILYAGLAPGFAGLYQINLTVPLDVSPDPEIRLAIGDQTSPASIRLAVQ